LAKLARVSSAGSIALQEICATNKDFGWVLLLVRPNPATFSYLIFFSTISQSFLNPFLFWGASRGRSQRRTRNKILTVFRNIRWSCWPHTNPGPGNVGDTVTPSRRWSTSGPLSRGCS